MLNFLRYVINFPFDIYPVKCTGTIAFVFLVIAFSIKFTFMQNVLSQSTKTGFAPISVIAPTVATKVLAAVITSSPLPIFKAFKDNFIASVPELTPIANLVPINFAKFFSNCCRGFPSVKSPVSTNFLI